MADGGEPLDDLRGHFSESDTDPVTLDIVKTFPSGWKNLPQELVDEILIYLKDDFLSLVSCSTSCKALFCSARPSVHRTFCLSTGILADRYCSSARNLAQFDNLRLAERAQVLQYTTQLIIRLGSDFVPENLRPHLRYFRAMRRITSLEIHIFDVAHFLPIFEEFFGHIASTLRSLFLIRGRDSINHILHFVSRFPLLQDLDSAGFTLSGPIQPSTPPDTTTPPPLNGILRFRDTHPSATFIRSIVDIPGGIHFCSVEMGNVGEVSLQMVLNACSNTLESITFGSGLPNVKPNLRNCTVLKRLRITIAGETISYKKLEVYLSGVLATIKSPSFSIFIVKLSGPSPHSPVPIQFHNTAFDDLASRGANTGMVFRVEPIDPLDRFLPTGPEHLLRLEPCRWDAW